MHSNRKAVVPDASKEAMEVPEVDKWRDFTKLVFNSLVTLGVFERIPSLKVPPGAIVLSTRWVFEHESNDLFKDASIYKDGVKFLGSAMVEPTLVSAGHGAFGT